MPAIVGFALLVALVPPLGFAQPWDTWIYRALALLLIVTGFGQLLKAVTAFTVAHSITLALATLGMVHVPAAPTEAIIALSILFLATEIIHKHSGQISLTERYF